MNLCLNSILRYSLLAICVHSLGCASQPGRVVSHPLQSNFMETAPTGLYRNSVNAAQASSQASTNEDEPVSAALIVDSSEGSANTTAIPTNYFDSDPNPPKVGKFHQISRTVRKGSVKEATPFSPMPASEDSDPNPPKVGDFHQISSAVCEGGVKEATPFFPMPTFEDSDPNPPKVGNFHQISSTAREGGVEDLTPFFPKPTSFDSDPKTPDVGHFHQISSTVREGGVENVTSFFPKPTSFADAPIPVEIAASESFILPTAQLQGQYMIESGDTLEIKFRIQRDLNEIVNVRPDGMISLQIVGDFPAAGFTCEQLRRGLIAAYSDQLQDPDIAVIIRTFASNGVFIGGEVNAPGRVALNGHITTLQAIILAGGFKDTADQRRVVVRHGDGTCCEYDLKSVAECSTSIPDVVLSSSDVVYVPKSHIAKVNLFVEQYIDKVLPFSRSFGVFINQQVPGTSF